MANGAERPKGFDWIEENWKTLPQNLWLGVTGAGIVAEAKTAKELRQILNDRPKSPEPAVVVLRQDGKPLPVARAQ